jgi:hypothetical protein
VTTANNISVVICDTDILTKQKATDCTTRTLQNTTQKATDCTTRTLHNTKQKATDCTTRTLQNTTQKTTDCKQHDPRREVLLLMEKSLDN